MTTRRASRPLGISRKTGPNGDAPRGKLSRTRIIVQKYGGTSVATEEGRARLSQHVTAAVGDGWSPVVVVSAMGRSGAPYATDTLLGLVQAPTLTGTPRDLDLLMSCGEVISAVITGATLRRAGHDTVVLTGQQTGIVTDDVHGNASIVALRPERIAGHLSQGQVVVVAGFQGANRAGEVTTLGRGGSDISAVALGAALHAGLVEIYTDVDGIKTADPQLVPQARTIPHMTYNETSQLAHEGARVLHPRAADMAARFRLPVRIRSTFTDTPGTLVTADGPEDPWAALAHPGPVTGVTHSDAIALVSFGSGSGDSPPYKRTFEALAGVEINIDMISVTPQTCSFIIASQAVETAEQALRGAGIEPVLRRNLAKISVVGRGMRDTPGVMARVSEALLEAGV
ncbi:MAG: aspartate kinase, partial [Bacillota bacterium]|nr:aspartate kinase [Bacillota bacterium]